MTKVQFITGLHGNEYMPTLAIASLGTKQIIGNPKALAAGKRYIDADLNSVFGLNGEGYEHQRAKELLASIDKHISIIDFHTFSAESEPFVIFVDTNCLSLAKKTGIRKLVYMKKNFKNGRALINFIPGVSVEVGSHNSSLSFDRTIQVVKNVDMDIESDEEFEVYEVYDILTQPGEYKNFQKFDDDFFPVLSGPNPYDFYGLKARLIDL